MGNVCEVLGDCKCVDSKDAGAFEPQDVNYIEPAPIDVPVGCPSLDRNELKLLAEEMQLVAADEKSSEKVEITNSNCLKDQTSLEENHAKSNHEIKESKKMSNSEKQLVEVNELVKQILKKEKSLDMAMENIIDKQLMSPSKEKEEKNLDEMKNFLSDLEEGENTLNKVVETIDEILNSSPTISKTPEPAILEDMQDPPILDIIKSSQIIIKVSKNEKITPKSTNGDDTKNTVGVPDIDDLIESTQCTQSDDMDVDFYSDFNHDEPVTCERRNCRSMEMLEENDDIDNMFANFTSLLNDDELLPRQDGPKSPVSCGPIRFLDASPDNDFGPTEMGTKPPQVLQFSEQEVVGSETSTRSDTGQRKSLQNASETEEEISFSSEMPSEVTFR